MCARIWRLLQIYELRCQAAGVTPLRDFTASLCDKPLLFDMESLNLSGKGLTTLAPFLDLVRMNRTLRSIDVSNNLFRKTDVGLLLDCLLEHDNCDHLNISGCPNVQYDLSVLSQIHDLSRRKPQLNIQLHQDNPPSWFDLSRDTHSDEMQVWCSLRALLLQCPSFFWVSPWLSSRMWSPGGAYSRGPRSEPQQPADAQLGFLGGWPSRTSIRCKGSLSSTDQSRGNRQQYTCTEPSCGSAYLIWLNTQSSTGSNGPPNLCLTVA